MTAPHDKPMAATPYKSYRYAGQYGWIMIGAMDTADALREAARSVSSGPIDPAKLQKWNGSEYVTLTLDNP